MLLVSIKLIILGVMKSTKDVGELAKELEKIIGNFNSHLLCEFL